VRATQHAPRGPFRLLERRRGFAETVERGGGVLARPPDVRWGKSDEPGYCMNMFSPETYSVKQKRKKKGLQHWRAFGGREEEEG